MQAGKIVKALSQFPADYEVQINAVLNLLISKPDGTPVAFYEMEYDNVEFFGGEK